MTNAARRFALCTLMLTTAWGCTTMRRGPEPEPTHGVASWYGEEFAGRTTANGEIFDPLQLTAAHRTLPFGTILDVTNPKTSQTVRVRVNDRGPYIENRLIDLSYAAARQIGLVDDGIGEVDIAVVKLGSGDREPPVPFDVTMAGAPKEIPPIAAQVVPPLPPVVPRSEPAVVDRVEVQEERGGVTMRKRVAADGTTIETVPVATTAPPAAVSQPPSSPTPPMPQRPRVVSGFVVQAGAFASETNAKALQGKLVEIGERAWIEQDELYRVRIGPFATDAEAVEVRRRLESRGMSAIIVRE